MGAARRDTKAMKGSRNLAACVLGILTACIDPPNALCTEESTVLVTLDQEAGENGLCHVHYKDVDRTAPCTKIVALMQSELHIPAHTHVTLQASKTARYEQISQLLQLLRDSEYDLKIGYITSQ
jgi:biopolymer transport protein ExbD